jgi:ligand-binding SRPBCC domain-containing protein
VPVFEAITQLSCSVVSLFDFLARPANLLLVSPPDLQLKLTDAPDRLQRGSQIAVTGRRWGIVQRMVNEVTVFEPESRIVEEQRHGPFRRLVHTRRLSANGVAVKLTDHIEFEPPGGMIGLMLTAERIRKELEHLYQFRTRRMKELLEPRANPGRHDLPR